MNTQLMSIMENLNSFSFDALLAGLTVIVLIVVVVFIKYFTEPSHEQNALEILESNYTQGKMNKEEFEEKKRHITG